jgi:hypothetical protein
VKAVFGIVGLVIVLAIVGSLAKKQLQAIGGATTGAGNAGAAVEPNGKAVPQQARDMQERARANTARALEQGAERNQRADP